MRSRSSRTSSTAGLFGYGRSPSPLRSPLACLRLLTRLDCRAYSFYPSLFRSRSSPTGSRRPSIDEYLTQVAQLHDEEPPGVPGE